MSIQALQMQTVAIYINLVGCFIFRLLGEEDFFSEGVVWSQAIDQRLARNF